MSEEKKHYQRPLNFKTGKVEMNFGAGGKASAQLIADLFAKNFSNEFLDQGDDGASKEVEDKMAEYALCLGRAFQIIDDVLDYTGTKDNIGKNLGTDLREGKMTMPLIYALRHCSEEDAKIIRTAVSSNDPDLESVTRVILASGAIDACIEAAKKEVSRGIDALNCLPTSAFKNSLIELLSLTVERDR